MITNPIGMLPVIGPSWTLGKVGITNAGGGVKVGKRVGAAVTINCAAKVGSMVLVISGVGVGGGSTIGNSPGVMFRNAAKTQPTPPGAPGYSINIHSLPGDLPTAGAVCPNRRTPTRGYNAFGPERTLTKSSFAPGRIDAIGPGGVPVTVGILPVGIWA